VFKKQFRLTKSFEIQNTMKKGRRFSTPLFSLFVLSSSDIKCTVIVSKKTEKKAVERNFLKRRTRSAYKDFLFSLPKPYSVVILPKKEIATCDFEDIKKSFQFAHTTLHL
jgi:ribonuclease P protein component